MWQSYELNFEKLDLPDPMPFKWKLSTPSLPIYLEHALSFIACGLSMHYSPEHDDPGGMKRGQGKMGRPCWKNCEVLGDA